MSFIGYLTGVKIADATNLVTGEYPGEDHRAVRVAMRLPGRIARRMPVLVLGVMHVPVLVLERFMQVLVFVRLCHVQIDTDTHELRRPDERKGRRVAEQREREGRADERGGREVSAGARGS